MRIDPKAPAFPRDGSVDDNGNVDYSERGMPVRTWLAGLAMQGLLANAKVDCDAGDLAKWAVESADALIAELNKVVEE